MRVAVVGATGAVGSTMLGVMRERSFPADEIVPVRLRALGRPHDRLRRAATSRSRALSDEAIQGFDLALFSAGSAISEEWGRRFADAGAVVVDNSSFWRMHDDVPLVVAEVNPDALDGHRGIVANPNCTTMQTVVALKPILDAAGIERVVASTYQAVSGTGQRAVEELHDQALATLEAKDVPAPSVYPHQIAFNVLPQVEKFQDGDDYTTEERKVMRETRKILGRDDMGVSATCARVPVYTGHSVSANVQTRDAAVTGGVPRAAGRGARRDGGGRPRQRPLPAGARRGRPRRRAGRAASAATPRTSAASTSGSSGDNLRKGAATNAVQVAELLKVRNLLGAARAA